MTVPVLLVGVDLSVGVVVAVGVWSVLVVGVGVRVCRNEQTLEIVSVSVL